MSGQLAQDIKLVACDRQLKSYLTTCCVCTLALPLWCGLGCCCQTVVPVVVKSVVNTSLQIFLSMNIMVEISFEF